MSASFSLAAMALLSVAAPGSGTAAPEPHLALRTGLKCSQCHVNRTGGGMRSEFGSVFGQTQLPIVTNKYEFRNRALNDWVSIGANLRASGKAVMSDAEPQTAIELDQANITVEARVIRQVLAVYIDQTVGPGRAAAREVFGLVEGLPLNGYAKAGKFFLPYGFRIVDEQAFVRDVTGFNMTSPDQGVEIGIEPGPLAVSLAVTNGTVGASEGDDQKQVTGRASVVTRRVRLGGSASHNQAGGLNRDVVGGFGGFNVSDRLSVLGEFDFILADDPSGGDLDEFVAWGEGNLLLSRGVNAKFAYGYHDPNLDVDEDQRIRLRFGLEVFPIPFLQTSAYLTVLDDVPSAPNQEDRATVELHFFF